MLELFTTPKEYHSSLLDSLYPLIKKVMPLKDKQYKALPRSIQDLSYILTQSRGEIAFYWSSPALLSAYFYYFMPWNLVRFAQCIPNLIFPDKAYIEQHPYCIDIGSGPLTIPLALWLFREDLRDIPLTIYCFDTAKKPMEYGKQLLEKLIPKHTWNIILLDARKNSLSSIPHKVSLCTASNVANELVQKRTHDMESVLERFYNMLTTNLAEYGHALCMEVGTRLGGQIITQLHNIVSELSEYTIIAPCTHHAQCPYTEDSSTWCHFSFADFIAPSWLEHLSHKARLPKKTLSTSLLHFGNGVTPIYNSRILSAPIYIPKSKEFIRYTCTEQGITALEKAKNIVQGTALHTKMSIPSRIDEKTKVPFVTIDKEQYKKQA